MHRQPFKLPTMAWWLLVVSGFFHLSIGLSNTFVNIFLFKVDHSFAAIAWYNLLVFISLPFTFVVAAWVARKTSTAMALRIGIILHAVFYAVTLMVGEQAAHMPELLGLLTGVAEGFYWLAFDVLSIEYTDKKGHEPFFGIFGVLTSVANVVAPPVAGLLISREDAFFGGLTGYHVVFGISFALFIAATLLSFRLHSQGLPDLRLFFGFRALRRRPWRKILIASSLYGIREGVFMFLIGLLVYVATGSEMKLGEFLLLQGALSFAAFFFAGRFSGRFRWRLLVAGAVGMACAACLFLLPIRPWTIILYGCVTSATLPFFLVPLQGYVYDVMDEIAGHEVPSTTHIVVREWFENAGRIAGTILFILICRHQSPQAVRGLSFLSFGLGLVQLATVALVWQVERRVFRRRTGTFAASFREDEQSESAAKRRVRPTS
ncbi:YQGE family putative transporter [Alicyclobacillus sacchari]|uniref:YQGE family putative transporter n=1 Tax=Alicyclobacillus sacchari TaxID=392010 RepID=A0A4R8LPU5_9BACL|nr:MFS transporter [Alicyclobacillus sacchari]TDY49533.1 YQGE family putative transporter [Alicyclobacillus sacchari]